MDGAMAPAVASGVEAVLERGIEPGLVHLMQQLQLPASDHQLLLLAALLRLHTAAHRYVPLDVLNTCRQSHCCSGALCWPTLTVL